MFRRSDSQTTFGSLAVLLSPRKRAYLETKHWSGAFRRKALPVLLQNEPRVSDRFAWHHHEGMEKWRKADEERHIPGRILR